MNSEDHLLDRLVLDLSDVDLIDLLLSCMAHQASEEKDMPLLSLCDRALEGDPAAFDACMGALRAKREVIEHRHDCEYYVVDGEATLVGNRSQPHGVEGVDWTKVRALDAVGAVEVAQRGGGHAPSDTRTAYLVGVIDTDRGQFLGCSVFSEDTPTLGANMFCFTIHKEDGADYAEALAKLTSALTCSPSLAWARLCLKRRG